MKYFIDATIVDKLTNTVKQKLEYDVNSEATVTLESAKTELLQWVVVPKGYKLSDEKLEVGGKKRASEYLLEDRQKAYYTAFLEELPKVEKNN